MLLIIAFILLLNLLGQKLIDYVKKFKFIKVEKENIKRRIMIQ